MNRRAFVTSLGAALAAPLVSEAQRADKLWRVGSVLGSTPESSGKVAKAIEASLAATGYVPGRNITLEYRFYTRPLVAHCHAGLATLYRRTEKPQQAAEHFATATTMYREMGMTFWLEKLDTELKASS